MNTDLGSSTSSVGGGGSLGYTGARHCLQGPHCMGTAWWYVRTANLLALGLAREAFRAWRRPTPRPARVAECYRLAHCRDLHNTCRSLGQL